MLALTIRVSDGVDDSCISRNGGFSRLFMDKATSCLIDPTFDSRMSEREAGSLGIAGREYVKAVRYVRKTHVVRMRTPNIEDI